MLFVCFVVVVVVLFLVCCFFGWGLWVFSLCLCCFVIVLLVIISQTDHRLIVVDNKQHTFSLFLQAEYYCTIIQYALN